VHVCAHACVCEGSLQLPVCQGNTRFRAWPTNCRLPSMLGFGRCNLLGAAAGENWDCYRDRGYRWRGFAAALLLLLYCCYCSTALLLLLYYDCQAKKWTLLPMTMLLLLLLLPQRRLQLRRHLPVARLRQRDARQQRLRRDRRRPPGLVDSCGAVRCALAGSCRDRRARSHLLFFSALPPPTPPPFTPASYPAPAPPTPVHTPRAHSPSKPPSPSTTTLTRAPISPSSSWSGSTTT